MNNMILSSFPNPKLKICTIGSGSKIYDMLIVVFIILKPIVTVMGRTQYSLIQAYYIIMLTSIAVVIAITLRKKMYYFFIGGFLKKSLYVVFLVLVIFNIISRELKNSISESEFSCYIIMWVLIGVA